MQSMSFQDACARIRQELKILRRQLQQQSNVLLAVTGYVASGKSRFCSVIRSESEVILGQSAVYLPFDLWVNSRTLNASTYAGRFFMEDLIEAVRCIRDGKRFLVPRYDLAKNNGIVKIESRTSTQELLWNGRSFFQNGTVVDANSLYGSAGLWFDSETGYPYSLFLPSIGKCFLLDGTLVVPPEIRELYDLAVFVEATWPLRVSRMLRRYNRKEVFGATRISMRDYVGFLVAEARECADAEIVAQRSGSILVVKSEPDTLSNYLDLAYLLKLSNEEDAPNWAEKEEVETAMRECLDHYRTINDTSTLLKHRQELIALMESKHLLAIPNVDQLLTNLNSCIL